jgi:hypothetical protein
VTKHKWVIEEVDGGTLGTNDFWKCSVCGAGGGPVWPLLPAGSKPKPPAPGQAFLANGSGLELPDDCDTARAMIVAFKAGYACALWGIPEKVKKRFEIKETM